MKINKLSLNYLKTKAMLISNQKLNVEYAIKIRNYTIEQVNQIKYLGVIFDNKLSWKQTSNIVI